MVAERLNNSSEFADGDNRRVTLTWTVSKTVPIPCPDRNVDPYTGEMSMIGCAVYHCEMVTEERVKTFNSEIEANLFMKNAPSNCTNWKTTRSVSEATADSEQPPSPIASQT